MSKGWLNWALLCIVNLVSSVFKESNGYFKWFLVLDKGKPHEPVWRHVYPEIVFGCRKNITSKCWMDDMRIVSHCNEDPHTFRYKILHLTFQQILILTCTGIRSVAFLWCYFWSVNVTLDTLSACMCVSVQMSGWVFSKWATTSLRLRDVSVAMEMEGKGLGIGTDFLVRFRIQAIFYIDSFGNILS